MSMSSFVVPAVGRREDESEIAPSYGWNWALGWRTTQPYQPLLGAFWKLVQIILFPTGPIALTTRRPLASRARSGVPWNWLAEPESEIQPDQLVLDPLVI